MRFRISGAVILLLLFASCGSITARRVRDQAATDLQCAESEIELESLSTLPARYRARGCGRQALYRATFDTVDLDSQIEIIDLESPAGPTLSNTN